MTLSEGTEPDTSSQNPVWHPPSTTDPQLTSVQNPSERSALLSARGAEFREPPPLQSRRWESSNWQRTASDFGLLPADIPGTPVCHKTHGEDAEILKRFISDKFNRLPFFLICDRNTGKQINAKVLTGHSEGFGSTLLGERRRDSPPHRRVGAGPQPVQDLLEDVVRTRRGSFTDAPHLRRRSSS